MKETIEDVKNLIGQDGIDKLKKIVKSKNNFSKEDVIYLFEKIKECTNNEE